MARGRKTSLTIRLTPADQQTLQAWQRSHTVPAGLVRRGRIMLLRAEGMAISDIAATVGISRRFVYKWLQRFRAQGMEGLADKPGRGGVRTPSRFRPSVAPLATKSRRSAGARREQIHEDAGSPYGPAYCHQRGSESASPRSSGDEVQAQCRCKTGTNS
jgi:transposase